MNKIPTGNLAIPLGLTINFTMLWKDWIQKSAAKIYQKSLIVKHLTVKLY